MLSSTRFADTYLTSSFCRGMSNQYLLETVELKLNDFVHIHPSAVVFSSSMGVNFSSSRGMTRKCLDIVASDISPSANIASHIPAFSMFWSAISTLPTNFNVQKYLMLGSVAALEYANLLL